MSLHYDHEEEPVREADDVAHVIDFDANADGYLAFCLGCYWHAPDRRERKPDAVADGVLHAMEMEWQQPNPKPLGGAQAARPEPVRPAQSDPMPALHAEYDDLKRIDRVAVWSFALCLAFTCIALGLSWPLWAQWVAFGVGWGIGALVGCRRHKVATDRVRRQHLSALLRPYGGGHVRNVGRQW